MEHSMLCDFGAPLPITSPAIVTIGADVFFSETETVAPNYIEIAMQHGTASNKVVEQSLTLNYTGANMKKTWAPGIVSEDGTIALIHVADHTAQHDLNALRKAAAKQDKWLAQFIETEKAAGRDPLDIIDALDEAYAESDAVMKTIDVDSIQT